jgi:hypothetical protein
MFFIEYVITQGQTDPSVVYSVDIRARTSGAAEQVAQGTLDVVRRMFPATPPNGFQIIDDNDEVVVRSWERISTPVLHFHLRLLGVDLHPRVGWEV